MNENEKLQYLNEYFDMDNAGRKQIINQPKWIGVVPKKLYRYRPLLDDEKRLNQEIEALISEENYIWGNEPGAYKDDPSEFLHLWRGKIDLDNPDTMKTVDTVLDYILGRKADIEYIKKVLDSKTWAVIEDRRKELSKSNLNKIQQKQIRKELKKMLASALPFEQFKFGELLKSFRNNYVISCFCTESDDQYMWKNYANGGDGICLQYDILKLYKAGIMPVPVLYCEKNAAPDIGTKLEWFALIKNAGYRVENEWRWVNQSSRNGAGKLIPAISPEKIILGRNISATHRTALNKVIEKKQVIILDS